MQDLKNFSKELLLSYLLEQRPRLEARLIVFELVYLLIPTRSLSYLDQILENRWFLWEDFVKLQHQVLNEPKSWSSISAILIQVIGNLEFKLVRHPLHPKF